MPHPFPGLWPLTLDEVVECHKLALKGPRSDRSQTEIVGFSGQTTFRSSRFTRKERNDLTLASMRLANNQVNEACNKFYATVQLAYAVRKRTFPGDSGVDREHFSGEFVLGALIPVLYYSQVAALLSIFSSYGLVFVRDKRNRQQRQQDDTLRSKRWHGEWEFLLIRKKRDWNVLSRCEASGQGRFHQQLVSVAERFFASGVDATAFDLDLLKELKRQRELVDYAVLGETSLSDIVGFQNYLKFLPRAHNNIKVALDTISKISGITNNCDVRMQNLEGSILRELLFEHPYSIQLELWKFSNLTTSVK